MARIVVKPIPRKKFNVKAGGKHLKLTLSKRNYNASMPNHYPNTRVGLLEHRLKTLEDNQITLDATVTQESTNGVKSSGIWAALQALLQSVTQALAKLFIPTKTSELENDSNFITSSSLTKANIEGLKDTDSSTFADTLIPALADPASYDPATVAYLTELFGELSDSVKESILRTWGRLQDITNKVAGLQEDVIADVEVTENVAFVEIDLSHLHINARTRLKVESYLIFVDELGDAVDDRVIAGVSDILGGYRFYTLASPTGGGFQANAASAHKTWNSESFQIAGGILRWEGGAVDENASGNRSYRPFVNGVNESISEITSLKWTPLSLNNIGIGSRIVVKKI